MAYFMRSYLFSLALFLSSLEACTGIMLIAKDGSIVHGRTLEFGVMVDLSAVVVPRGVVFKGTTPLGEGLTYRSKYGAVGCAAFGQIAMMDGMNEKGLSVGTFYFPGFAGYTPIDSNNQSKALSPVEFPNWILTQFQTVQEVKVALATVVIAPTVTESWGTTPAPFHYIVYDKKGDCLVIEPIDGKLVTYENKWGTFTNSPTFDWHVTHLRNYINLTPFNSQPIQINGITLSPFGQGSGMVGLPGDFTPPSRFVRAALFSSTAIPSDRSPQAIGQLFHILNQFDIPVGAARSKEGDAVYCDQTQVTCARDPQTLKYYYRTYEDPTIKVIDLNAFDLDEKKVKMLPVRGTGQAIDVSKHLK